MTEDSFDKLTQLCEEMTGRPWDGTFAHLAELSLRQREATEILNTYSTWLSRLRTRALESGNDWTSTEIRRQSRLDGDLTTPPEWLIQEAS